MSIACRHHRPLPTLTICVLSFLHWLFRQLDFSDETFLHLENTGILPPKPLGFSASSLLGEGRERSDSVELIPDRGRGSDPVPLSQNPNPSLKLAKPNVMDDGGGYMITTTGSSGNLPALGASSSGYVGFSSAPAPVGGGGGSGFTASSLLGSFQFDEAEMLKGPAPKGGGGGFTLSASMLGSSSGGGEDGGLIGGPANPGGGAATIGLLPTATPKMSEAYHFTFFLSLCVLLVTTFLSF